MIFSAGHTNRTRSDAFCKGCVILLLAWCLSLAPSLADAYQWTGADGLRGWTGNDIASMRQTTDGMLVSGLPNSLFFGITLPVEPMRGISRVSLQLRTLSINPVATCVLMFQGQVVAVKDLVLISGRSWREYSFPLAENNAVDTPFDSITFGFAFTDSVEIRNVTIDGPSVSELFLGRGIQAHTVNGLFPFKIRGYSANLFGYGLFLICGLITVLLLFRTRKKSIPAILCIVFLVVSFLFELREDYEELDIMQALSVNYVIAPPDEKRYHWAHVLVEFADFIKQNVSSDKATIRFFGQDARYGFLRYLLYPLRFERGNDELGAINAFSTVDEYRVDGDKLLYQERVVHKGGRGVKFNERSFLYFTR